MQFRILTAAIIFLGSYLPLGMILLAQNYDYSAPGVICWSPWTSECRLPLKNPLFSLGVLIVCGACFAVTLLVLKIVRAKHQIEILDAKYVPSDLMNYTLPYVVSFMSIDYQDIPKFVGLLIFLLWMFWITYKSGQVLLNPLLIVLGWRLYDITYEFSGAHKKHIFNGQVLANCELSSGETHPHAALSDILLVKKQLKGRSK